MSFLRRLFVGQSGYSDKNGLYLYAKCDHCGAVVRVRADKQHDLNRESSGYTWHKTIVDSQCFRRMQAVVHFDESYNVAHYTLTDGEFVDEAVYNEFLAAKTTAVPPLDSDET